jgi:hypothetical protein
MWEIILNSSRKRAVRESLFGYLFPGTTKETAVGTVVTNFDKI